MPKYSSLPKENGKVRYLGRLWEVDKWVKSNRPGKKLMVLAKKGDEVKLVHFGDSDYKHNYSPEAKKSYLARASGIRDKNGNLTKDDKFSPNYWAIKVLWSKNKPADGKAAKADTHPIVKARMRGESDAYVDGVKGVCCCGRSK